MNTIVRLDRLSALLHALAPEVTVMGTDLQPAADLEACLGVHLVGDADAALTSQRQHSPMLVPDHVVIADVRHRPSVLPVVSLRVHLEGPAAELLMREFAQPLILPLAGADSALTHAVALLCSELSAPRCGQPALLSSAGDILFIGLLRHLVANPHADSGLIASLANPRIAAVLVGIHECPQAHWDLAAMATLAGMSRTAFATRFKETMRTSPGKYLAQIRLHIAQRAVDRGKGLKGAARDSGYRDLSALSRALSRARTGAPQTQKTNLAKP
jgi:AraC-like DNA-binding protein